LYRELAGSQPNLQVAFLQAHYEKTCDELLADKSLTQEQRNFCLRRRSVSRYFQNKPDTAIADLEELLLQAPKDASLHLLFCRCHLAKNDLESATKALARLQSAHDGTERHRFTCELAQAEIDLARIEAGPEKGERRARLVAQTVEQIDKLVRRAPQQPDLYRLRAAARFHAGEAELALADSETCLKLAPFTSHKEMVDVVFRHALILEKLHRFDHSLQYTLMAMHLEGDSPRIRGLLAQTYKIIGKTGLARVWQAAESSQKPGVQPLAEATPAK
jgi:tetratricopeptide (TPR) repeat protein